MSTQRLVRATSKNSKTLFQILSVNFVSQGVKRDLKLAKQTISTIVNDDIIVNHSLMSLFFFGCSLVYMLIIFTL